MTAKNSSLHRRALKILKETPPFSLNRILEEVACSKLFPDYPNNRDRYDIVLPDFKCVIELHGIQHFKLSTFGADAAKALIEFQSLKLRDAKKREIALLNGWTYLEIPYTDEKKFDGEYLLQLYQNNFNEDEVVQQEKKKDNPFTKRLKEEQKARARAYRKEQYRRAKEFKRNKQNEDR